MLVRNYGNGLGPGWRKAFNTDSLEVVREYCARGRIDLEVPTNLRFKPVSPRAMPAPRREPLILIDAR
jgi:hypothetical protein